MLKLILVIAYQSVREEGTGPVYRAAQEYAGSLTSLRYWVDKSIDCIKSGPETLLSQLEEAKLVANIKELAAVGYVK